MARQGLSPKDIGYIGSAFLLTKWATWGTFMFLGVRYRPLLNYVEKQLQKPGVKKGISEPTRFLEFLDLSNVHCSLVRLWVTAPCIEMKGVIVLWKVAILDCQKSLQCPGDYDDF